MAEGNQMNIGGNRNAIVQGAVNSVINIGVNPDTSDVQYDLTSIPIIPLDDVVGRNSELEKLHELLHNPNNQAISVVSGLGGIGKTTLAQAYVTKYAKDYTFKAWITQIPGGDFKQDVALTQDLADNLGVNKEAPTEQMFNEILQSLRRLQNNKNGGLPNLLIIDNADETLLQYKKLLPQPPHWHVLITSREALKPFKIFELDFLNEAKAIDLYQKHHKRLTDEQIKDIITLIDRHTLTISILGQSAAENQWDYEQVKTALTENRDTHITHPYADDRPVNKIKTFLTRIFNFSTLSSNQLYILSHLALMPSDFLPLNHIKQLMQYESLEWQDEFVSTLNKLYSSGWLLKAKDKQTPEEQYKLHIIVSDIIKEQALFSENILSAYTDHLTNLLSPDNTENKNPVNAFKWITYGEALGDIINNHNKKEKKLSELFSTLLNNLALRLRDTGNLIRAKDHLIQSLEINIETLGKNHSEVAIVRSNLALIYWDWGNLEKAVELAELALHSDIANFGEGHANVARCRNNLAQIHQDLGNLQKATELTELALYSDIKNFGEDHPNIARYRNNLAQIYRSAGDFQKAAELLVLALNSGIKNFGEDHPEVAILRNNVAQIYRDSGELQKAAELIVLALNSDIKNFGEDHSNVAIRKNNLAQIYADMKHYKKAIQLFEEAYSIFLKVLGDHHANTQTVKQNLEFVKNKANSEE